MSSATAVADPPRARTRTSSSAHGGSSGGHDKEQHAGYLWLAFCAGGMISSLTLYGILLEYVTSGGRTMHEMSFVFITCSVYTCTAYLARFVFEKGRETHIPKYKMALLSLTSVGSTFTSVRSLRYVIYPVQVLAKSCKPVPVMLFGVMMGKKYPMRKYVNVLIITAGVALFMGGGSSAHSGEQSNAAAWGAAMLAISLCFDGATGAYEDKLMSKEHVEPFDLMFHIQLGKSSLAFLTLVLFNELHMFLAMIREAGLSLLLLGVSGALGQVFVFLTISKFGALNCAIIGLARKVLSLTMSFILYGHHLNAVQMVGLVLAISAMIANFREKRGKKHSTKAPKEDELEMKPLVNGDGSSAESGDGEADTNGTAAAVHAAVNDLEQALVSSAGDGAGSSGPGATPDKATARQTQSHTQTPPADLPVPAHLKMDEEQGPRPQASHEFMAAAAATAAKNEAVLSARKQQRGSPRREPAQESGSNDSHSVSPTGSDSQQHNRERGAVGGSKRKSRRRKDRQRQYKPVSPQDSASGSGAHGRGSGGEEKAQKAHADSQPLVDTGSRSSSSSSSTSVAGHSDSVV